MATISQVPEFVSQYIDFLATLEITNPVAFFSRYGISDPNKYIKVTFQAIFDLSGGWAVEHLRPDGSLLFYEIVAPPLPEVSAGIFSVAAPTIQTQFNNPFPSLSNPSQLNPPPGYFVLEVLNNGLPSGYAATTYIQSLVASSSLSKFTAINGIPRPPDFPITLKFDVPFHGTYELPVWQSPPLAYYVQVSGNVQTNIGSFKANGPFYSVSAYPGQLVSWTINWVKETNNFSVPSTIPILTTIPTRSFGFPSGSGGVLTPATESVPINIFTLMPSSYSLIPYQNPPNTFRATDISQMFNISPDNSTRLFIYNVGISADYTPIFYTIRNNTVSNVLQFSLSIPSFLNVSVVDFANPTQLPSAIETRSVNDITGFVPGVLNINPSSEIFISVGFNEEDVMQRSQQTLRSYAENLIFDIKPLNVTGPVFVSNNLVPLTSSNEPPLIQENPVVTSSSLPPQVVYTNLYAAFAPTSSVPLTIGSNMLLTLDIWAGDPDVQPGADGAIQLQFGPNSVLWTDDNPNIMDVESSNADINAVIAPFIKGSVNVIAQIYAPPLNISNDQWNMIFSSSIEPINGTGFRSSLSTGQPVLQVQTNINISD